MSQIVAAYFHAIEPLVSFGAASRQKTTMALRAARIGIAPEFYLAVSYAMSGVAALALAAALFIGFSRASVAWWLLAILVLGGACVGFAIVRLAFLLYPRIVSSSRARQIDAEFPSVIMLCYALAKGGVDALAIFRAVAQERHTYGEISREFALVMRDIEWMGQDMNTALQSVAATTPSATLKAFFEGLVTMLNSGADPRDYFKRHAATQLAQAETAMEKEIDQAGLLAESYVSGLLVLPLLLIVVLSVLGALKSSSSAFIPLIVFGLMPLGTVGYLVLLDMFLPPEVLALPKPRNDPISDFGMDSVRSDTPRLRQPKRQRLGHIREELDDAIRRGGEDAARATRVKRVLVLEWIRRAVRVTWKDFVTRAIEEPLRAFLLSMPIALLVFGAGAYWLDARGFYGSRQIVGISGLVVACGVLACLPVSVFHEIRVRRARVVDGDLPETLSKLAGFNERGVGLLRSFQILGRTSRGPLGREMRSLDRDVSWSSNLRAALVRMRARVATRRMMKVGILFERGTLATGNLKEALEIAAQEAAATEHARARKRQAMMTYLIVIYVVFAVFLYVLYTVAELFYGAEGLNSLAASRSVAGLASAAGAKAESEFLYLNAVLIQGACCGVVAGKLGEGHVLSGLKHAAILAILAWVVFALGVMW